jgi:hypothetical protein
MTAEELFDAFYKELIPAIADFKAYKSEQSKWFKGVPDFVFRYRIIKRLSGELQFIFTRFLYLFRDEDGDLFSLFYAENESYSKMKEDFIAWCNSEDFS